MKKITFVSFNINGLRARFHQLEAIMDRLKPDVIGLQETKVHDDMFPIKEISHHGYHIYYHGQKGHYGVALLFREKPIAIRRGFSTDDANAQRRIIMGDFMTQQGIITVINVYCPQGENRDHPVKFPAKRRFYKNLQRYLTHIHQENSLLLIMGDMNITPTDLDIGISENNQKSWIQTGKCSFLPEERTWIANLLNCGLVDTYRQAHPKGNKSYSWFDYRFHSFDKNRGLRIDLFLASPSLAACFIDTGIDYSIRAMEKPSDHAPVWVKFNLCNILSQKKK